MTQKWIPIAFFFAITNFCHAQDATVGDIQCIPQPMYGYRADGKPGRQLMIKFIGGKLSQITKVQISGKGFKETPEIKPSSAADSVAILLLPTGVGVDKDASVMLNFTVGSKKINKTVIVPSMRYWTIYLYNHSHVDIGYTNTHKNVERLHTTNVIEGMKLAKETQNFPEGAKFKWNPEVTWPVERLWLSHPEERENILQAIKNGHLGIDASYLNLNTSVCADEELFHAFKFSRKLQKLTGKPIDVFQQFDIPGVSWGIVPVLVQQGIKYIIAWPNTDRAGLAHKNIDQFPFWWVAPDGKSKVLFFQPGGYANSGSMGKGGATGRPWFGQRDLEKVPRFIKTGSANVNFTDKLVQMEKDKYPYDFLALSWSLWDNNPIDADIPYAVKEWNEKYAFPKIIISGGREIMRHIETKYGSKLPLVKGDYTEYWTDGLGTAAELTAMNRNSKEKLIQAESLWTMLGGHRIIPRSDMNEAWRFIALGSEHTWCFENPAEPFFQDAIFKVKTSYFHEAADRTLELYDDALAPATDKSNGALGAPGGSSAGGVAVFNTHSWANGGIITLNKAESSWGDKVIDANEQEVPTQRLSTGGLAFLASDVPAFGSKHYRVVKGSGTLPAGCKVSGNTLENGIIKVTVDGKTGNIIQLIDLKTAYNYADQQQKGGLNTFWWLPANADAPVADSNIQITVTENGPLVAELQVKSKGKGVGYVIRSVRLVAGQPWVDLNNVVDKLPMKEKDGVHFGFGFNIPKGITRYDIPWGVVEIEKEQWQQANRNWLTLQRWLDISNDSKGITWCSLDAPLFEYGKMTANIALGWGGKGPWIQKLEPASSVYSWVMNNHWHTNFPLTQEGSVNFRYRIMPHNGYNASAANRFGMEQAQPLAHVMANLDPQVSPLIQIDNHNVAVTILKTNGEDRSVVIRLRSLSDKEETVNVSFGKRTPQKVYQCNIEENPDKEVAGNVTLPAMGMLILKAEF